MQNKTLPLTLLLLSSCGNLATYKNSDASKVNTDTIVAAAGTKKAVNNWSYSDQMDDMDNIKSYFAETTSPDEIELPFPYNGGSTFTLTVRRIKTSEVIVTLSKGQFTGESVRVKFDAGKPETISYSNTSDGRGNIIFLSRATELIKKIKKAQHLFIEFQFFDYGSKTIEFNVAGLEWNH